MRNMKRLAVVVVVLFAASCGPDEPEEVDLDIGAADCANEWLCDEEEEGISAAQELVLNDEQYLMAACQGLLDQVPDTTEQNFWGSVDDDINTEVSLDAAFQDYTLYQACVDAGFVVGRAFPPNCSGVTPPDSRGFNKRIALTFDDGPANPTPGILDTLAAHGAPATFFVNGKNLSSSNISVLARAVEEGHLVGHHTHTHVNSSKQDVTSFVSNQLDPTTTLLHEVYAEAGVEWPEIPFFRFPYGATTCEHNNQVMGVAGFQIVGWHIDTADWCFSVGNGTCPRRTFRWVPDEQRDDFVGYTLSQAQARQGGILLLHDVKAYTGQVLDELLTALEDAGFIFVRLDDAEAFPLLNDGIGLGDGEIPEPDPTDIPFNGASCRDRSGEGMDDNSGYGCVDVSNINFRSGECDGNVVSGFCAGPWNIKCCVGVDPS